MRAAKHKPPSRRQPAPQHSPSQPPQALTGKNTATQPLNGDKTMSKTNIRRVHIILQGKGGVGKSTAALAVAQALAAMGRLPLVLDTDPVNHTMLHFPALGARAVEILDSNKQIDHRAIDLMWDMIINHAEEGGDAVVDNGATSFVPMTAYIAENNTIDMLAECGVQTVLHTVLIGGQAMADTLRGLSMLIAETTAPIVVWINEKDGPVQRDGRGFEQSAPYQELVSSGRLAGVVTLPASNPAYAQDWHDMTSAGQTFNEAAAAAPTRAQRARIETTWARLRGQLHPVLSHGN